ncbi:hypothetical protein LTR95_000600 [Oleoguttula sp. CCFEE 5521]
MDFLARFIYTQWLLNQLYGENLYRDGYKIRGRAVGRAATWHHPAGLFGLKYVSGPTSFFTQFGAPLQNKLAAVIDDADAVITAELERSYHKRQRSSVYGRSEFNSHPLGYLTHFYLDDHVPWIPDSDRPADHRDSFDPLGQYRNAMGVRKEQAQAEEDGNGEGTLEAEDVPENDPNADLRKLKINLALASEEWLGAVLAANPVITIYEAEAEETDAGPDEDYENVEDDVEEGFEGEQEEDEIDEVDEDTMAAEESKW